MIGMHFKFFGVPSIRVDNVIISPSLKRGEALLYYIAIKKRVSRNEVTDLFWNETDRKKARKNLRNLLYKLKQDLGFELIISINRETLVLNPNIRIITDYENFLEDPAEFEDEVLKGFCTDIPMFESWKKELTEKIKRRSVENSVSKFESYLELGQLELAEDLAGKILKIDCENMMANFVLMNVYNSRENYEKLLEAYERVRNNFENCPDEYLKKEIEDFYKKIKPEIKNENRIIKPSREDFFMRDKELETLKEEYRGFISEDIRKVIMIHGEAGIGKTHLLNKFFDSSVTDEVDIIYYNCSKDDVNNKFKLCKELFYQARELWSSDNISLSKYFFKSQASIYSVLEKLDKSSLLTEEEEADKLDYMEKSMSILFGEIKRKFIFAVDNIQWADRVSLSLLAKRIPSIKGKVMFVSTVRDEGGPWVKDFLTICLNYDSVKKIDLNRFGIEETFQFIDKYSEFNVSDKIKEIIYKESDGNPFFIVEYLENLNEDDTITELFTENISKLFRDKLQNISVEELDILKLISLFNVGLELETLNKIYGSDGANVRELLRNLIHSGVIKERYGFDEVRYRFSHNKFKGFIHSLIEESEKNRLQKKVLKNLGLSSNEKGNRVSYLGNSD